MKTTTIYITDEAEIVLDLAVHGESLYTDCDSTVARSHTIDRLIEIGYLVKRPMGYVRVTDAGNAAYRLYA